MRGTTEEQRKEGARKAAQARWKSVSFRFSINVGSLSQYASRPGRVYTVNELLTWQFSRRFAHFERIFSFPIAVDSRPATFVKFSLALAGEFASKPNTDCR